MVTDWQMVDLQTAVLIVAAAAVVEKSQTRMAVWTVVAEVGKGTVKAVVAVASMKTFHQTS